MSRTTPDRHRSPLPRMRSLAPPPPHLYGPMPAGAGEPATGFFDWIRSLGVARGTDRWVGGVSSGIAHRLGVDPLIVRGVLIVLTIFAGVGILFYGIAWALLPEPDGRIHAQEAACGPLDHGHDRGPDHNTDRIPGSGKRRLGLGPLRLRLRLDRLLGWRRDLLHLLPEQPKQKPERHPDRVSAACRPTPRRSRHRAAAAVRAAWHRDGVQRDGQPGYYPYTKTGYTSPAMPAPGAGAPGGPLRTSGPSAPAVAITAGAALVVGGGLKALDAVNVIDLGVAGNAVAWAGAAAVLGLGILLSGLRGRTSGVLSFFAIVALAVGAVFNVASNRRQVPVHQHRLVPHQP